MINNIMSDNYNTVTHCIFDFDGTLVDSEAILTHAINDVLKKFGKQYDWAIKSQTVGLHLSSSGPIIIKELDLPLTKQEFTSNVLKRFEERITTESIGFMAGAERLVKHLAKNNVNLAICTGSLNFTYNLKVKHFGQFFDAGKYFSHIVKAGDDPNVKNNKPSADPYIYCISLFDPQPSPQQVLVFEDTPTGMTSALRAGCQCVLIPDKQYDKSLFKSQATLVIDSLNDFKPELFGLPKY